jgi:predicted RNA-binding protein
MCESTIFILGEEKTITGELKVVDSVKHQVIVREK